MCTRGMMCTTTPPTGAPQVHLILRHRNAKNGSVSEKHLTAPPVPETNDYTHVYTLRIKWVTCAVQGAEHGIHHPDARQE